MQRLACAILLLAVVLFGVLLPLFILMRADDEEGWPWAGEQPSAHNLRTSQPWTALTAESTSGCRTLLRAHTRPPSI